MATVLMIQALLGACWLQTRKSMKVQDTHHLFLHVYCVDLLVIFDWWTTLVQIFVPVGNFHWCLFIDQTSLIKRGTVWKAKLGEKQQKISFHILGYFSTWTTVEATLAEPNVCKFVKTISAAISVKNLRYNIFILNGVNGLLDEVELHYFWFPFQIMNELQI